MSLLHNTISCATEGCFAVITLHPQEEARLRRTHETFHCPAGHRNYFAGKTEQENEIDLLRRTAEREERLRHEWRDRWEALNELRTQLVHSMQVCPLGCGWRGTRRLAWQPGEEALGRFFDRAGSDLAEHLAHVHGAERTADVTGEVGGA